MKSALTTSVEKHCFSLIYRRNSFKKFFDVFFKYVLTTYEYRAIMNTSKEINETHYRISRQVTISDDRVKIIRV